MSIFTAEHVRRACALRDQFAAQEEAASSELRRYEVRHGFTTVSSEQFWTGRTAYLAAVFAHDPEADPGFWIARAHLLDTDADWTKQVNDRCHTCGTGIFAFYGELAHGQGVVPQCDACGPLPELGVKHHVATFAGRVALGPSAKVEVAA